MSSFRKFTGGVYKRAQPMVPSYRHTAVTREAPNALSHEEGHDLLIRLSDHVPGVIFKFKMWPDGRSCFPYISDTVSSMYPGVTPEMLKTDATKFFGFRHPDDAIALQLSMRRSMQTMEVWDHEYRLIIPGQGVVWRHGTARPERQTDGSTVWFGLIMDVTERKHTEEALKLTSSVFETSNEGIVVIDGGNRAVAVNPAFTQITGFDAQEMLDCLPECACHTLIEALFPQMHPDFRPGQDQGKWDGELFLMRKNCEMFPAWVRTYRIHKPDGETSHQVAIFEDISDKRKADDHIWHQANYDYLTDLPNRRLMISRLERDLQQCISEKKQIGLLLIDLDNFKEINDTLGHGFGDQVLKEVSRRLCENTRSDGTIARLGGDEFTVTVMAEDAALTSQLAAEQICYALSEPIIIQGERVFATGSIGVAIYPTDASDVETLIKHADQALYASKRGGRNRLSRFTIDMQSAASRRRLLADHLYDALSKKQFEVFYQPIFDLRTMKVAKAEALLRWNSTLLPRIGPAEFIPAAEEHGLIHEIGDWVFKEAAKTSMDIAQWTGKCIQITVNISPRQLAEDGLSLRWRDHLKSHGIHPDRLAIEITEGIFLESQPSVLEQLRHLRNSGIHVALDDFGTGYSAMSYLLKFEVDIMKIDKSFVRNITSHQGQSVLEAMVAMAHKLGLQVVAEGVENIHELNFLSKIGCDFAQGYLLSEPLSAANLKKFLLESRAGALSCHAVPELQ